MEYQQSTTIVHKECKCPPFLNKGDRVGIVAPGKLVTNDIVEKAQNIWEDQGFNVSTGQHLFKSENNYFSAPDELRLSDLQTMLDDTSIRAIVCARGGYGMLKLLDKLNFTSFIRHPKWILGCSDITALHSAIASVCGMQSMHCIMPLDYTSTHAQTSLDSMFAALIGKSLSQQVPFHLNNIPGEAQGIVVGGNLSLLMALAGTRYEYNYSGTILFIEEIDEALYHLERMLMNLKMRGVLASLKGMIVGSLTRLRDSDPPYGKTAERIINELVSEYNIPLAFGLASGHCDPNLPIITGSLAYLRVGSTSEDTVFSQG